MSIAYFIGGLLPMIPYFAIADVFNAFYTSIGVTIAILLVFGYGKAAATGCTKLDSCVSALHTLGVGAFAAAVSYAVVRAVNRIAPSYCVLTEG